MIDRALGLTPKGVETLVEAERSVVSSFFPHLLTEFRPPTFPGAVPAGPYLHPTLSDDHGYPLWAAGPIFAFRRISTPTIQHKPLHSVGLPYTVGSAGPLMSHGDQSAAPGQRSFDDRYLIATLPSGRLNRWRPIPGHLCRASLNHSFIARYIRRRGARRRDPLGFLS